MLTFSRGLMGHVLSDPWTHHTVFHLCKNITTVCSRHYEVNQLRRTFFTRSRSVTEALHSQRPFHRPPPYTSAFVKKRQLGEQRLGASIQDEPVDSALIRLYQTFRQCYQCRPSTAVGPDFTTNARPWFTAEYVEFGSVWDWFSLVCFLFFLIINLLSTCERCILFLAEAHNVPSGYSRTFVSAVLF